MSTRSTFSHFRPMRSQKFRLISAALASFLLVQGVDLNTTFETDSGVLSLDSQASARRGGGRSRGGSFRRSSPPRSRTTSPDSGGSTGTGSRSGSTTPGGGGSNLNRTAPPSSFDRPYNNNPGFGGGPVIVPVPVPVNPPVYNDPYYRNDSPSRTQTAPNPPGTSSNPSGTTNATGDQEGNWLIGLLALALIAGVAGLIIFFIIKAFRKGASGGLQELDNNTVTVTKLQVTLLAQARQIQMELSDLTTNFDPSTPEGLQQQLQESVLALLRTPENWSYVQSNSQVARTLEEAEAVFEQLSIAERSKFDVETLANVGGRVRRQTLKSDDDEGPASYIVVTLLVGTAHDKPLLDGAVRTSEELTAALQRLAAIPPDYLMVFELIWTPQDPSDSLSYDELLSEYPDLIQL